MTIAPTLSPLLLRLAAGSAWSSTSAGPVLSLYCYYIPLLAINGILEAFVSAVATPAQLRTQGAWLLAFSGGFAGAGWVLLGLWGLGARGLVAANAANMGMRIVWSWVFVSEWLGERGVPLRLWQIIPGWGVVGSGVLTAGVLGRLRMRGGVMDLVEVITIGGACGLTM
jgi:oligosaccharide translocation protein RFT1